MSINAKEIFEIAEKDLEKVSGGATNPISGTLEDDLVEGATPDKEKNGVILITTMP